MTSLGATGNLMLNRHVRTIPLRDDEHGWEVSLPPAWYITLPPNKKRAQSGAPN